jgi:class 3 adenylate cyclase
MREVAAAIAARHADWPRFRIGVHTGLAVVGNIGAHDQRSLAAIGDTTNVAARLQSVAEAGHVLISEATRRELGVRAHVESRGALALKGRKEPVEAYELTDLD